MDSLSRATELIRGVKSGEVNGREEVLRAKAAGLVIEQTERSKAGWSAFAVVNGMGWLCSVQ